MNERIGRLRQKFAAHEVEAMLVTDEINVRYLTGFTGDSSSLLVGPNGQLMLSDGRYKEQLAEECPGLDVAIKAPSEKPLDFLAENLKGEGFDSVAMEADDVSVEQFSHWQSAVPGIRWAATTGLVSDLRMIKDAEEIDILRRAVRINERALESVLAKLGPDWTEMEIAYELESTIRRLGATGFSFDPIVGAGPGGAKPHYQSGSTVIGDFPTLLIDWGTCLGGYASDLTRCFHFGQPPGKFLSAYQAVLDSQLAAIEAIRPGVQASKVDAASREVLQKAGLAEYFVHGLGHGVGLQIHEMPRLSSVSDDVLEPGMVITVEPGVYFEGDFGIRIEDDVLVTETGHEVLSRMPKGLDDCLVML